MPVLDDFRCKKCGFTDEFFREVDNPEGERACTQEGCDGSMARVINPPVINDSSSATFIGTRPADYKHLIRSAKANERWKGVKDHKKRKELQEVASELNQHKT